jgi:hypothetical protein
VKLKEEKIRPFIKIANHIQNRQMDQLSDEDVSIMIGLIRDENELETRNLSIQQDIKQLEVLSRSIDDIHHLI